MHPQAMSLGLFRKYAQFFSRLAVVPLLILSTSGCVRQNNAATILSDSVRNCPIGELTKKARTVSDWNGLKSAVNTGNFGPSDVPCLHRALDEAIISAKESSSEDQVQITSSSAISSLEEKLSRLRMDFQAQRTPVKLQKFLESDETRTDAKLFGDELDKQQALAWLMENSVGGNLDDLDRAVSHMRFYREDMHNPFEDLQNLLSLLGKQVTPESRENLRRTSVTFATALMRAAISDAFIFSSRGKRFFRRQIVMNMSFAKARKDKSAVELLTAQLRNLESSEFSVSRLKRILGTWLVGATHILTETQFSDIWHVENEKAGRKNYWKSLELREGDMWLRTTEEGVGDLFSKLAGVPSLATHSGIIAAFEEDGTTVTYLLDISFDLHETPLSFSHEIVVRPNFNFPAGITETAVRNLQKFGKVRFDTLFTPGIQLVNGVSYIYCSEFIHYLFLNGFDQKLPFRLSPYEGVQLRLKWATEQLAVNAEKLGYSQNAEFYVPTQLLFLHSTVFVGSIFTRSRPKLTGDDGVRNFLRKKLDSEFLKLMESRPLREVPKLEAAAIDLGIFSAGIANYFMSLNPSRTNTDALSMLETINFENANKAMLVKVVITMQSALGRLESVARESNGSIEQAEASLEEKVLPPLRALFN